MANNKSSIKRIKTNQRKRIENAPFRSLVKTFTKKYLTALEEYKISKNEEKYKEVKLLLNLAYGKIDKAKKKKIIHQNTASRKKSRLGRALTRLEQSNSN